MFFSVHGVNEINGDSGEIVSPLFPSPFFARNGENQIPSWRITVESGATIYVRFSVFELEINGFSSSHECLSTVVIYDGFDDSHTHLRRSHCYKSNISS